MAKFTIKALLLSAVFAVCGGAHASTITFDELPPNMYLGNNNSGLPSAFTTSGYVFSMTSGGSFIVNSPAPNGAIISNGSTFFDLVGTVSIKRASNALFSVSSLDLGTYLWFQSGTVRLTGTYADGSTVTTEYTTDKIDYTSSLNDFAHQTLVGFDHLASFDMELVMQTGPTYAVAFDNISTTESPLAEVPEPGTPAMLGLGLALVVGLKRRKKAA
jgi:hypothetical protein